MEPAPDTPCRNCGTPLQGAFCYSCGQYAGLFSVPLWQWLREFLDEQFALSAKLPRTLWLLFRRPGFLTAEWRAGRHASYTPPVRLYVLAFLVNVTVLFTAAKLQGALLAGAGAVSEATKSAAEALIEEEARRLLTVSLLLLVPLLALLLKVLFLRQRMFFVEHLVFSLHLHTVVLLGLTFFLLLSPLGTLAQEVLGVLFLLSLPVFVVFLLRSLRRAYGGRDATLAFQQIGLLAGYAISLTALSFVFVPRLEKRIIAAHELTAREFEENWNRTT